MIYFIDFEDSFNNNILSYLEEIAPVKIIHYSNFSEVCCGAISSGDILCLGPGPGHISEYLPFLGPLAELIKEPGIMKVGICLGHQILLHLKFNCSLEQCQSPIHGQKVYLQKNHQLLRSLGLVQEQDFEVQRYNSWTVDYKNLDEGLYVLDSKKELALFYNRDDFYCLQFHPESVGTSCPELFFQPLRSFLR
ncbi:glutamine amidotransferase [Bacteriovorax sp. DB6_IX]|uniref:glutamine amidotransferase-related protein n=1 Tax=Bacteriovorax sp. DB6_IX TaxID=1353530 RepID=UPI00038A1982|nr:glutamine amidotransferase [Bacteriovorax sp. DB6_IX]EQC52189.1 class I glutamine amidotransferase [Bacteriovorax sp. DB6_IX]